MSELPKALPDTASDEIGRILAQAATIDTMTKVKRDLIAQAVEAMIAAGYVSIRGSYQSYDLSRIGQSCQYDVPLDRKGALLPFRGKRVRVAVAENTGRNGAFFSRGLSHPPVRRHKAGRICRNWSFMCRMRQPTSRKMFGLNSWWTVCRWTTKLLHLQTFIQT